MALPAWADRYLSRGCVQLARATVQISRAIESLSDSRIGNGNTTWRTVSSPCRSVPLPEAGIGIPRLMPDSSAGDDPGVSADRRVDGLLQRMALTEKAAQLGSVNANRILPADGMLDEPAVEESPYEFRVGHSDTNISETAAFAVTDTK